MCKQKVLIRTSNLYMWEQYSFKESAVKSAFLFTLGIFLDMCYFINTRHLIVHSKKGRNWLYIQRKSQISCKFGERAEMLVIRRTPN